jgi:putative DNA primase/helicase
MGDSVSDIRKAQVRAQLDGDTTKAVIQVRAGEMPRIVTEAQSALLAADAGIYQRGGQLVRIVKLDMTTKQSGVKRAAGSTVITPLVKEYLTCVLAASARFEKFDGRVKKMRTIDPPPAVSATLLAMSGEWQFPVLGGLATAPTLRPDGSLLDRPGYDTATGLFGVFEPGDFPKIDPRPSRLDACAACDVLNDLFSECAFEGDSDSAHASVAIAALITAALRQALPIAPAFGISAYKASSGKTTIAKTVTQVCTGRVEPAVLSLPEDETELRKCLLSILIAGDPCVLIDNVNRPVDSAALCALLTSAVYADRVLGVNTKVALPTAVTWMLTGNHLQFVGDLTTRVLLCVLDPQLEHPEARQFKRDLPTYVAQHRGELLAAALTIPLAYFAAGAPRDADAPRSRFREWDHFVRQPLLWLDLADPLSTQEKLRSNDIVREGLVRALHACHETFGENMFTVADIVREAGKVEPGQSQRLFEAMRDVAAARDGTINARSLGRYLQRSLRRIEDGVRFDEAGEDPATHRRRFRISVVNGVSGVFVPNA